MRKTFAKLVTIFWASLFLLGHASIISFAESNTGTPQISKLSNQLYDVYISLGYTDAEINELTRSAKIVDSYMYYCRASSLVVNCQYGFSTIMYYNQTYADYCGVANAYSNSAYTDSTNPSNPVPVYVQGSFTASASAQAYIALKYYWKNQNSGFYSLFNPAPLTSVYGINTPNPSYSGRWIKLGDIDNTNYVNNDDVQLILDDLSGSSPLTGDARLAADANLDGVITLQDAVDIVAWLATPRGTPIWN